MPSAIHTRPNPLLYLFAVVFHKLGREPWHGVLLSKIYSHLTLVLLTYSVNHFVVLQLLARVLGLREKNSFNFKGKYMTQLLMILLVGLVMLLIVAYAVSMVFTGRRKDLHLRALYVQDILQHIHALLHGSKAPIVLTHGNKTTAAATFSARNFFCDCLWPARSSSTESGDTSCAILRTLDGYLGLEESSALRERLQGFSVHAERDATLKFLFEEDAGSDAAARKQHGIYYKLDVEHASGKSTPVMDGILPKAILETVDNDRLLEEIFAAVRTPNNR